MYTIFTIKVLFLTDSELLQGTTGLYAVGATYLAFSELGPILEKF